MSWIYEGNFIEEKKKGFPKNDEYLGDDDDDDDDDNYYYYYYYYYFVYFDQLVMFKFLGLFGKILKTWIISIEW